MDKKEIQELLQVLKESGTMVAAGDIVFEKKVEHEVNNVEAGGIGIQIVKGGSSPAGGASSGSKGLKVEDGVFVYKWAQRFPGRVTQFYQMLVKLHAIDGDTDHEEFEKLFTGVPTDVIVKWLAPKSVLHALIKELKDRKYISPGGRVWVIAQSHFKGKDDKLFTDLRNQHAPEGHKMIVQMMADVLDPRKDVPKVNMMDDDLVEELWGGVKDKVWEVNH